MTSDQTYKDLYKIIIIGNSGVGKSNIVQTFIHQKKIEVIKPTVGVDYYSKYIPVEGVHKIKAQVWDTAGSQQYRSITYSYYKKALGIIIVFDVTNKKSFNDVDFWIDMARERGQSNAIVCLIGNKIDKSEKREVSRSQAEKYAQDNKILYAQTTINDTTSIERAFQKLVGAIYKEKVDNTFENIDKEQSNLHIQKPSEQGCKCCKS